MEMLHGSDGWGKLVSELQQKEEDDAQQAAVQEAAEQQQPAGKRRKRARNPKEGSASLAQGARCAPPSHALSCSMGYCYPALEDVLYSSYT